MAVFSLTAGAAEPPTINVGASTKPAIATRPASTQPAAIIHVDNIEHDFGDVWSGQDVQYAFEIYNRGQVALQIRNVRPQCGCTVAGEYPRTIEPGKSGKFPFSVKTAGFRGRQIKLITIDSNDPVTPTLSLRLLGNFRPYIDVSPAGAFFSPIVGDKPVSRVVKITNNTEAAMTLKLRPVPTDRFTFDLVETRPGKEFELRVNSVVPHKPGEVNVEAALDTNIEQQKTVAIRVNGRVPERLDLHPASLIFSRGGQPLRCWLDNYGASLVKIKEATTDDPAIKVKVAPILVGKTFRIDLDVPAGTTLPPAGRVLTVKTDDPEKPELTVKILPVANKQLTLDLTGQPAPQFSLTTFDGKSFAQADLKDKITVLDFVSPVCPWCKKQLPVVEPVRAAYESKGVRFICVVNPNPSRLHEFGKEEVTKIMDSLNVHLELAFDPQTAMGSAFGTRSYPTMVVVGKDGKVAAVNVGLTKAGELQGQLDALLAGKPIPVSTQPAATQPAATPAAPPAAPRPITRTVGQPAPDFSLTIDDKAVTQSDLKDKITVLNFVSPTCPWCKKQLPVVEPVRQAYVGKGVRFINVVNSNPTRNREYTKEEVRQIMEATGAHLELALDPEGKAGTAFKATGYPSMVVVGKDAKVAAVNVGLNEVGRLKGQLDALLEGKPVTTQAAAAAVK
jgi:thiol-disulfide isomerase/thioredoxin